MALIGKIREKSGWAIGIVAAGLGLFIVGGDILSPTSVLRGNHSQVVGKISGEEIPVAKFQQEIDEMRYTYYLNTNKTPGEEEMKQFLPQAWNQMIFKVAYQKEFDALGLEVGKEEVIDMVQGRNIHPALFQSFKNPQTGQFDVAMVKNYLQNISRDQKQQAIWLNFEKNLGPDRLRTKYEALLKKSIYVTKAETKREYLAQSDKVALKYFYVPYTSIPDNEIQLSNNDFDDYLDKNKSRFVTDPSANIEYVSYPIIPSKADTVNFFSELNEIVQEFKKTDDDSLYSALNADNPVVPAWNNPGELPQSLQKTTSFKKDSVYGPFSEGTSYKVFKIVDLKTDTAYAAKASHILFRWDSESDEDKKKALDKAKDILAKIKKGEKFEDMARQHGTDGTASQGGDLGWFGQGRMVKEFQEAVFKATSKGLLPEPVKSQFGYHLIKVTETKTNKKYFIASIDKSITAGDDTRDSVYKKAEALALNSKDIASFNIAVQKEPGLSKMAAPNVSASSTYINNLSNPKEIIRWIFLDAKPESISPVFEVDNQFIVAALSQKYERGEVNVESNKQQIGYLLLNDKKAEKLIEKIGADNSNIEDALKKIGNTGIVNSATDITLASSTINMVGYEPEASGYGFGLKEGKTSKLIKGTSGVLIVQTVKKYPSPDIADYTVYKSQLLNTNNSKNEYFIGEAIKNKADIVDERYKFF